MKRLFKNGRLISLPTLPVTTCEGCGACCRHMGAPPGYEECWRREGMDPEDLARWMVMPPEISDELVEYYKAVAFGAVSTRTAGQPNPELYAKFMKTQDEIDFEIMMLDMLKRNRPETAIPCLWLDLETMKCKHYEHRPQICRDVPKTGDEVCLSTRKAFRIPLPVTS